MKKSPNQDYQKCKEMLSDEAKEGRLLLLSENVLSDTLKLCSECNKPLGVFRDDTIRCKTFECKLFMVIASGSQMFFDF